MDAMFIVIAFVIAIVAFDLVAVVHGSDSRDGFGEGRLPAGLR